MRVRLTAGIAADLARRTLVGTVYRYGETGHTSAGPLGVSPTMPVPPIGLPITLEHDREVVRAHVAMVDNNGERLRIAVRVVDGELGDAALAEAADRTRAAFSLDLEDAEIVDGLIVSGRWEAIGQVADPAFNSARIDRIAAATTTQEGTPMLTDEQRARLDELIAKDSLTPEEANELNGLLAILQTAVSVQQDAPAAAEGAAAPAAPAAAQAAAASPANGTGTPVAASMPAVPSGGPHPSGAAPARTQPVKGQAFAQFVGDLTAAMQTKDPSKVGTVVTAALQDITHSAHTSNIEQPAWSGELWSGLLYEPVWLDLFSEGVLTNYSGIGWRFTSKLEIQDYAGNKTEIPSDNVTTETSTYTAARMAVGVDVDRKFYDFPNEGFVEALWQQVRESWTIKLDGKVRAYGLANATQALQSDGVTPVAAQPTLLKAAAVAARALKRRRVGRATGIVVNEEDYFTLLDIAEKELPIFLDLFGIDPRNFRPDEQVPAGTVVALAKQAATVRTLPGSPVRVSAQHLANGGIDDAFFGYWAVEEHHTGGIAKATFTPA
jgi:hypothetical protein